MTITVMNAEGEIQEALTGVLPERPEIIADNVKRGLAKAAPAAEKPAPVTEPDGEAPARTEPEDDDDDGVPTFVKRYGLTKEQNEGVTEAFRKAVGKKNLLRKEAEAVAASHYTERLAADKRAEMAERMAEQLAEELARAKAAATPAVEEKPAPKPEDFKTTQEYNDAVIDWKVEQKFSKREADAAKEREERRQAEIRDQAAARIKAAKEAVPDFDEVIASNAEVIVPPHIGAYMQESPLMGEMLYHFGQHPEDLERLAAMPTRSWTDVQRLGVAIGKIEGMLKPFAPRAKANGEKPSVESNGAKPPTSKPNGAETPTTTAAMPSEPRAAAPVIQPLNSGSASQVEKPASKQSYGEARSAWEQKHGKDFSKRARH